MVGYWRFNEAGNKYIADLSNIPTDIDLNVYMEGKVVWQYVDEPFAELALQDEIIMKTIEDTRMESISHARTLRGDEIFKLTSFKITGEQTLEFWVILSLTLALSNRLYHH